VWHSRLGITSPKQCRQPILSDLEAASGEQYDTGGLILPPDETKLVVVALDRDRRFHVGTTLSGVGFSDGPPTDRADHDAGAAVDALSHGRCDDPKLFARPGPGGKCGTSGPEKVLVDDLRAESPEPTHLGGDFGVGFYGVSLASGHYYTLVMFRSSDAKWVLADAFRAR
jgi:hypothetical protein